MPPVQPTEFDPSCPPPLDRSFLICPIEDWLIRDRGWTLDFPMVVAVLAYALIVAWSALGRSPVPYKLIALVTAFAMVLLYLTSRAVWRRNAFREARSRRLGPSPDRFRSRERLAQLRGRRGWARLARSWPGPRTILIGLRQDPAALDEVQLFEPIDVSGSPRPYAHSRPVRYREIHITAMLVAMSASTLVGTLLGLSTSLWIVWFVPTLPVAWGIVWLYRKHRVSALVSLSPIQLVSTVVEPGRVTRTVFGLTRDFESGSGLLIVRAMSASPKRHLKAQPTEIPIRLTLINALGQRSSITVHGVDHPTIADVLARWTHPVPVASPGR